MISPRDLRGLRVGSSAALPTAITAAMVSVSGMERISRSLSASRSPIIRVESPRSVALRIRFAFCSPRS